MYGYSAVRADRPDAQFPGGGLITYIKHNIAYRKIGSAKNGCVEAMSVSIQQQGRKWLDLTNVYAPPSSSESCDISWLPATSTCIIAGDFNGHSKLWDHNQPNDKMGENVVDLVLANNLCCCNDGSPTRINRGTGGLSTPDVTLASSNLNNKITWTSIDDLGSDHMPIILEIMNEYTRRHVKGRRRKRWRRKNADWGSFTQSVESKLEKAYSEGQDQNSTLKDRLNKFNSMLLLAGNEHVGKTRPRRRDCWMNPAVRTALKKRNQLRREVREKRREWLEACEEAQNTINEAKHKAWEDYLSEVEFSADPCDMWRVIKSLSGTPDSMAPNEALIVNGKVITTNPKKAEAFAKLYAGVSKLTFNKQERNKNRRLKVRMRGLIGADDESCCDFDPKELENALKVMKTNGAPGADDIPPSFLKNLGPLASQELLNILNTSFRTGVVPRIWRHALIIPLLKAGKPSSQLSSYRPISLTSCVVKLLERMICARLYHIAESNGWICRTQAGFRRNQSTEDQVLRITQKISDGFQAKPARRTVLAMLDYSKAYDRVWRQELLHEMIDKGVPNQMVRWFRAFLQDRSAQVLYNGALSKKVFLRQGLPQGAVSSPLLFLFYINGLNEVIPENTDIALFADDASVWAADEDLNQANRKVQLALEKVEAWSRSKKMDLNVQKSEATFFSPATNEAKWRPTLSVNGLTVPFNPSPKFLGIHLDRSLSFQEHVKYVTEKVSQRCRMLGSLAGKQWGWRKENLRKVYLTTQRSVLDYAAAAWQPWLSETQMQKLERAQNKALRIVTGQYNSTPVEALRLESGVVSYKTHSKRLTSIAAEKADRLPPDHPRNVALNPDTPVSHRSKTRSSWREKSKQLRGNLPTAGRPMEPLPCPFQRPWASRDEPKTRRWKIFTSLPEPKITPNYMQHQTANSASPFSITLGNPFWRTINEDTGEDLSTNQLTAARAIKMIDEHQVDTVLYTDGSCKGGSEDGGSAVVITTGTASNPVVLEVIKKKGGRFTCSYEEEKRAFVEALKWMLVNQKYDDTVICSDSQSLLLSIDSLTPDTADIRADLDKLYGITYIHWIPSHINIPGNEFADTAAKEAALLPDPESTVSVPYGVAKAITKQKITDEDPVHPVVSETYRGYVRKNDKVLKSRKDATLIAQLRSGHCLNLAHYKNRLDDKTSATCPECEEEEETVSHWLKCPATIRTREKIFGRMDVGPDTLNKDPLSTLAFAEATLLKR